MKISWDKKYLKITFYVVLTLVSTYILCKIVDSLVYFVGNPGAIWGNISSAFGYIFSVCAVLVTAFIIAYLLDPLVDFLQIKYTTFNRERLQPFLHQKLGAKQGLFHKKSQKPDKDGMVFERRTAGAAITYCCILLILAIAVLAIAMRVGRIADSTRQPNFSEGLMDSLNNTILELNRFYEEARITLEEWGIAESISNWISDLMDSLTSSVGDVSANMVGMLAAAGSGVANFFMGLFIAFYFLRDKQRIKHRASDLLHTFTPEKLENRIRNILGDVHAVFSGYIRGQLTDAAIVGLLISVALYFIGVDFAVIIGIFSGIANIIPYFGAFIGFGLSVVVALLSGEPMKALWAAIAIITIQQIDGMFITPRVVGENVELSPVLVLLSLSIFGAMFGLIGMIFAVPACAIIKIFFIRFAARAKARKQAREQEAAHAGPAE